MEHVNFIANNVVLLSTYIVDKVNALTIVSNFKEEVAECIRYHKDYIGLDRFYIYTSIKNWHKSFEVELRFYNHQDVITVKFTNCNYAPKFDYKSALIKGVIIVTKPLCAKMPGIEYCGYEHNYLYVDQFSWKAPIKPSNIPVTQLLYGKQEDFRRTESANFITLYETLSEIEKSQLNSVVNINLCDLDDEDSRTYRYLLEMAEKKYATCVIKPHATSGMVLDILREKNVQIIDNTNINSLPVLTKEEWIRKVLAFIDNHFTYDYSSGDYYNSIIRFINDYKLPSRIVYDILLELVGKENWKKRTVKYNLTKIWER